MTQDSPFLVPKLGKIAPTSMNLPGSKSIALRQLALAALAPGTSSVIGVPACNDTEAMIDCLRALGADLREDEKGIHISGPINLGSETIRLNARMSGASTRLLIGIAALRKGVTLIDGHPSLRARTNQPLFDVLRRHGCQISSPNEGLPAEIRGGLHGTEVIQIDGSLSSQYISALLIIAPLLGAAQKQPVQVQILGDLVSRPYIDITLNEMAKRGITGRWLTNQRLEVAPGTYQGGSFEVEGDATAATYFAGLALLHGAEIELKNLGHDSRQGDYAFFEVMESFGAQVQRGSSTTIAGPKALKPVSEIDMVTMPDAALTLITLSPLLDQPPRITGLQSLHHKECDRLNCPAREFEFMGINRDLSSDSIQTKPTPPETIKTHTLNTYHDHRMAMAFSLIGSVTGNLSVDDPRVVDKTYPGYWADYIALETGVQ